jgi:hypothetical protein
VFGHFLVRALWRTHSCRRLALWVRRPASLLTALVLSTCLLLQAQDPPSLEIRVAEGDGLAYPIGSRATRGITIQILDDAGKPVEGVTVSFRLPDMGPGGTFSDGSKNETLTTHADGRASIWGMKWNRLPGAFEVRITATKGQARAGMVSTQRLTEAPVLAAANVGSSHKWLWIALAAVAAGAGAGAAFAARGGGSSSSCSSNVALPQNPCTASPNPLGLTQIGTPTINLGHP